MDPSESPRKADNRDTYETNPFQPKLDLPILLLLLVLFISNFLLIASRSFSSLFASLALSSAFVSPSCP